MSNPLVSVIIPAKNGERFLAQAIDSVLAQDYRPFELIVIDGHSSDATAAIARSYPEARFIEQRGAGIPHALNQGIEQSNGDLLAFLSADDQWTADKLSRQVDYLVAHPNFLFASALFRYHQEPGCALPAGFNPQLLDRELVGRIMETLLARRGAFERIGIFNPEYSIAHDVDWFSRAQDQGVSMGVVPQVLLHKRIHNANTSSAAAVNTPQLLRIMRASIQRRALSASGR